MDEKHRDELSQDVIETIRLAAKALTGFKRREFLVEIALKYCDGNPRATESKFGFSRSAVATGLAERRSGLRCLDDFQYRGRKKSEDKSSHLIDEIRQLVEPTAQADPTFHTTLAYTRITAKKVREQLLLARPDRTDVPCRQTVGTVLNRLGYRISIDTKAKVQIGPFARGGKSRLPEEAEDHDMDPDAVLVPLGVLELSRGAQKIQQLNVILGIRVRQPTSS